MWRGRAEEVEFGRTGPSVSRGGKPSHTGPGGGAGSWETPGWPGPAGVPGVVGPPSCVWRWDPALVSLAGPVVPRPFLSLGGRPCAPAPRPSPLCVCVPPPPRGRRPSPAPSPPRPLPRLGSSRPRPREGVARPGRRGRRRPRVECSRSLRRGGVGRGGGGVWRGTWGGRCARGRVLLSRGWPRLVGVWRWWARAPRGGAPWLGGRGGQSASWVPRDRPCAGGLWR